MTKLKYVEFGLENCDSIRVQGEHIWNLSVGKFDYKFYKHHSSVIKVRKSGEFRISLFKSADVIHTPFEIESFQTKVFDRLTCNDLVDMKIEFDDNTVEEFHVDWDFDSSDYTNSYQKFKFNKYGDMFIVVKKENNIEEVFDDKSINDEAVRDYMIRFNK